MINALKSIFKRIKNISVIPKHLPRFEVSIFTIFTIILSLAFGYFKYLFMMYFIALIHELSHVITAMLFKMKVENIKFMPFGFSAEFIDFEREKWYKQLIVIIMGPLSFFLTGFLLALMYKNGFLSYYGYKVSNNSNLFVALFNLIPFYPLDGGRAVDILLAGLLSEGWTRLLRYTISFLALLGIGYMSFVMKQIPLFIYLLILFIVQIFYAKKDYIVYLLKRLSEKNGEKIKFVSRDEVFRYRHCLKMTKRGIEDETTIIKKLLLKLNRHAKGKKEVKNINKFL